MKISWKARICFRPTLQEVSRCVQLLATAYGEKTSNLMNERSLRKIYESFRTKRAKALIVYDQQKRSL